MVLCFLFFLSSRVFRNQLRTAAGSRSLDQFHFASSARAVSTTAEGKASPPHVILCSNSLRPQVIQRTVVAFVLGGNVAGVIADFVAVGWYSLIANIQFLFAAELLQMAPSVDPNVTSTDTSAPALASLILQRNDYAVKIGEAVEAQMIIEICVLALIIGAFVLTAVLCFVKLQRSISAAGVLGQNNVARRRQTFIGKLKSVMGHMHNLQFRICLTASFVFVVFVLKIFVAVVVAGSYNKTNTYAFNNACEDAGKFHRSCSCSSEKVDATCRCMRPLPLKLVFGKQFSRLQARHPLDFHPYLLTSDPACDSLG